MVTSDAAQILWKIHFYPNLSKKNNQKNRVFGIFLKTLSCVLCKSSAK